jgi:hypothetical protein
MHADLLEQDGSMQDGQDVVVLLHRIAGIRFYEGLFLNRLVDCLIRTMAYKQAMRLLASWDAHDQPTHGL